jgi:hypothetical protein
MTEFIEFTNNCNDLSTELCAKSIKEHRLNNLNILSFL